MTGFLKESPFPGPIILGIQPLVFWGWYIISISQGQELPRNFPDYQVLGANAASALRVTIFPENRNMPIVNSVTRLFGSTLFGMEAWINGEMHMDVSENSGTPKSSILIGFSIINHPFWGTPIFGNTHISVVEMLKLFFWLDNIPSSGNQAFVKFLETFPDDDGFSDPFQGLSVFISPSTSVVCNRNLLQYLVFSAQLLDVIRTLYHHLRMSSMVIYIYNIGVYIYIYRYICSTI